MASLSSSVAAAARALDENCLPTCSPIGGPVCPDWLQTVSYSFRQAWRLNSRKLRPNPRPGGSRPTLPESGSRHARAHALVSLPGACVRRVAGEKSGATDRRPVAEQRKRGDGWPPSWGALRASEPVSETEREVLFTCANRIIPNASLISELFVNEGGSNGDRLNSYE